MSFVPSLVEAFKGFEPGKADIVFVSSDRSADTQRRYMEEGTCTHSLRTRITFLCIECNMLRCHTIVFTRSVGTAVEDAPTRVFGVLVL